jgi:hypothetical protein
MPADEYCSRLEEQRNERFDVAEKAMNERHEAERDHLELRHKNEAADLADKRQRQDEELAAIKLYVEMWQRQDEERATVPASERDAMLARHDREHAEIAAKTGYEVRRPTVGDTTIAGFADVPPAGHPWVRRVGVPVPQRLHPEL